MQGCGALVRIMVAMLFIAPVLVDTSVSCAFAASGKPRAGSAALMQAGKELKNANNEFISAMAALQAYYIEIAPDSIGFYQDDFTKIINASRNLRDSFVEAGKTYGADVYSFDAAYKNFDAVITNISKLNLDAKQRDDLKNIARKGQNIKSEGLTVLLKLHVLAVMEGTVPPDPPIEAEATTPKDAPASLVTNVLFGGGTAPFTTTIVSQLPSGKISQKTVEVKSASGSDCKYTIEMKVSSEMDNGEYRQNIDFTKTNIAVTIANNAYEAFAWDPMMIVGESQKEKAKLHRISQVIHVTLTSPDNNAWCSTKAGGPPNCFSGKIYEINPAVTTIAAVSAAAKKLQSICHGSDATAPTPVAQVAPKLQAEPTKGQWIITPGSTTTTKMVWQYTPEETEFLALSFACNPRKSSTEIVVDLSAEQKIKPGQRIAILMEKGQQQLKIGTVVRMGESGPYALIPSTSSQAETFLNEPGDMTIKLPHHLLGFSNKSFPVVYTKFKQACHFTG